MSFDFDEFINFLHFSKIYRANTLCITCSIYMVTISIFSTLICHILEAIALINKLRLKSSVFTAVFRHKIMIFFICNANNNGNEL